MLTDLQKATAKAIVNIFETGRVKGRYDQVTLLPGDTGHLTYGRSQTTLASGNLFLLIRAYVEAPGATHAVALRPFLDRLAARDITLDHDQVLRTALREAGADPVMVATQDTFFDRVYWKPALDTAASMNVASPLGVAVVYDSIIHGSFRRIAARVEGGAPAKKTKAGERAWVSAYVAARRHWLSTHPNTLLHKTVYRMDAFQALIDKGAWDLDLPLVVRGVRIDADVLDQGQPVLASAAAAEDRILLLTRPFMRGDDVKEMQEALGKALRARKSKTVVDADGVFGPGTERALIEFQSLAGLSIDGVAGPATRAALGL